MSFLQSFRRHCRSPRNLWVGLGILGLSFTNFSSPLLAQSLYNPIPLTGSEEISDTLSEKDIPTGQGGFARDYQIQLNAGDQIAIDLISDSFDTVVVLMSGDGTTIAENDDAPANPEATTNSLLFTRINQTGRYIIRVRSFGEATGGPYTLKVTRLQPI